MYLLVVALAILTNLLMHCNKHIDQSANRPVESPQQASLSAQKSIADECDFTVYQPVRESHFVQRTVKRKVNPIYPSEAVYHAVQGLVNVKILVNREGNVEKACAIDGDPTLKKAAEIAALQWKFKPNFGHVHAVDAGSRKYMVDVIPFHFTFGKSKKVTVRNATTTRP